MLSDLPMVIWLIVGRTRIWIQWLQSPLPKAITAICVHSVEICSFFKAPEYLLNPKSRLTRGFSFSFLHFLWPSHCLRRSWTPSFLGSLRIWDQLSRAIWAGSKYRVKRWVTRQQSDTDLFLPGPRRSQFLFVYLFWFFYYYFLLGNVGE